MKNAKDNNRRQDFYKNMCRLHFYKYIQKNHSIPEEIRFFYKKKNTLLCKQKSLVKIRNRCIYTGRSRGVYKFCKLSRNLLQEKALSGDLLGFSKSSW